MLEHDLCRSGMLLLPGEGVGYCLAYTSKSRFVKRDCSARIRFMQSRGGLLPP
jgi:hypothetical protein